MWFRIDDGFYSHPKTFATSPAALGLWVVAGSWSAATGTGGMVPAHALGRLLPGTEALADELVVSGLWETTDTGAYQFHDWADYNPSAAESRAAREKQGAAGKLGNHRRWHLGRRQIDPSCPWCTTDRSPDRVPDHSPDRPTDRGGESPRRAPAAAPARAGGASPIGSDRVTTPETIGSDPGAHDDQHESDGAPDRVPDALPESGGNPPSRPDPTRPDISTSTYVGGVGESAAHASPTDSDMLPAALTDPITDPAPATRKADPKGHRLPDGFAVTDDMREWAREHAPSCGMRDHDSFVDYWSGVPGVRGRKLDWVRTWRNWMRREHDRRPGSPGRGPSGHQSATSDRVAGWLNLGTAPTPDPDPDQLALPAAQEVSPWLSA